MQAFQAFSPWAEQPIRPLGTLAPTPHASLDKLIATTASTG
jgi:hypothetical protein